MNLKVAAAGFHAVAPDMRGYGQTAAQFRTAHGSHATDR